MINDSDFTPAYSFIRMAGVFFIQKTTHLIQK
jgi:hypothetical protein